MSNTVTVSQLNFYIRSILEDNPILNNIFVVGEISNFKYYPRSGHMYLTLKDEAAQLKAVMFSNSAQRLKFMPEDGMRVVCRGRISVYDKDGVYQLYIEDMQPDGAGALNKAFEQLKDKLSKEGLFNEEHKKSLPIFPKKIGVATSNIGAAVEDIKNIANRRFPLCELVIAPTVVQGEQASIDIVNSIEMLDSIEDIDLIIVGRGGGSIEDLWAFNTEEVARAVFNCKAPVISAVGHETDYTICDFVADLRAPTPSAAAEIAVPDIEEIKERLTKYSNFISSYLSRRLDFEYQRLDNIVNGSNLSAIDEFFKKYYDAIKLCNNEMTNAFDLKVQNCSNKISFAAGKLNALSPLAVLSRGYSIVQKDDEVVKSVKALNTDDKIKVTLNDGSAICTVNEVKNEQ